MFRVGYPASPSYAQRQPQQPQVTMTGAYTGAAQPRARSGPAGQTHLFQNYVHGQSGVPGRQTGLVAAHPYAYPQASQPRQLGSSGGVGNAAALRASTAPVNPQDTATRYVQADYGAKIPTGDVQTPASKQQVHGHIDSTPQKGNRPPRDHSRRHATAKQHESPAVSQPRNLLKGNDALGATTAVMNFVTSGTSVAREALKPHRKEIESMLSSDQKKYKKAVSAGLTKLYNASNVESEIIRETVVCGEVERIYEETGMGSMAAVFVAGYLTKKLFEEKKKGAEMMSRWGWLRILPVMLSMADDIIDDQPLNHQTVIEIGHDLRNGVFGKIQSEVLQAMEYSVNVSRNEVELFFKETMDDYSTSQGQQVATRRGSAVRGPSNVRGPCKPSATCASSASEPTISQQPRAMDTSPNQHSQPALSSHGQQCGSTLLGPAKAGPQRSGGASPAANNRGIQARAGSVPTSGGTSPAVTYRGIQAQQVFQQPAPTSRSPASMFAPSTRPGVAAHPPVHGIPKDQRGGPQSAPPTGRQHHQAYTGHPASSGFSGRGYPSIQMQRGFPFRPH